MRRRMLRRRLLGRGEEVRKGDGGLGGLQPGEGEGQLGKEEEKGGRRKGDDGLR